MPSRPRLAMDAAALAAGAAGWQRMIRPGRVRRRFGLGESAAATYMLRLSGAILVALGLTLTCFSTADAIATA